MRARRLLVAAVVAAAAVLVPAPASAGPLSGGPVVVPSDGTMVTSPLTTIVGATYRVTVTGAYSYNGRQHLADCGWWNPETAGDAWFPGGFLQVNGATAECGSQPYTTTHTYTWEQPGTGAPFTFRIADPGGPYDNVGSLVADVVEVRSQGAVDGDCARLTTNDPTADLSVIHVVVSAIATGGAGPALASASCRFFDSGGRLVATVSTAVPGPRAYGTDVVVLPAGEYRSCYYASAFWVMDGASASDSDC
ncbi:MAG TPA: hypothetical protein VNQ77_09040 [Frankiaceae bacterium]|nr:hypothetical protein [Frankiaceae bacterium]